MLGGLGGSERNTPMLEDSNPAVSIHSNATASIPSHNNTDSDDTTDGKNNTVMMMMKKMMMMMTVI